MTDTKADLIKVGFVMLRRADDLAARNQLQAGADMQQVTVTIESAELTDPVVRDVAEKIVQCGRRVNVGLVIQVPTVTPFLAHYGGSQLLADAARSGHDVRLELAS